MTKFAKNDDFDTTDDEVGANEENLDAENDGEEEENLESWDLESDIEE